MRQFKPSDIINAHALEQMRRFRAGVWEGGSGIAANHSGSRTRLVRKAKPKSGAAIWEPYGSKGGAYTGEPRYGQDITELMRETNRLENLWATTDTLISATGSGNGELDEPHYIAHYNDEFYISEAGNNRIQVVDPSGAYIRKWGTAGSSDGQFQRPEGVGIHTDDSEVYVADALNDRMQVFNLAGTFQRKWGTTGSGNGQLDNPAGVYVDTANDEIYVVDSANNRVQVFNTAGTYQRKWGSSGSGDGQFSNPTGIWLYDSEVYVCDTTNNRVQVFNTAGTFQRKWSVTADQKAANSSPQVIFVDSSGVIVSHVGAVTYELSDHDGVHESYFYCADHSSTFLTPRGIVKYDADTYYCAREFGSVNVFQTFTLLNQTTFYRYPSTSLGDKVSLGTPDGGATIPALNGIDSGVTASNYILDMRTAIEALITYYTSDTTTSYATLDPLNWNNSDSDNAYLQAFDTGEYDWERDPGNLPGTSTYDVDINEIYTLLNFLATEVAPYPFAPV